MVRKKEKREVEADETVEVKTGARTEEVRAEEVRAD